MTNLGLTLVTFVIAMIHLYLYGNDENIGKEMTLFDTGKQNLIFLFVYSKQNTAADS